MLGPHDGGVAVSKQKEHQEVLQAPVRPLSEQTVHNAQYNGADGGTHWWHDPEGPLPHEPAAQASSSAGIGAEPLPAKRRTKPPRFSI